MIRKKVQEFVDAGSLPPEDASVAEIEETQRLLEAIPHPVSDEEAQLLTLAFGNDNCYGLAWTLLHLIETAPSAKFTTYTSNIHNLWVKRLNSRLESYQHHTQDNSKMD